MSVMRLPPGHPFPAYRFEIMLDEIRRVRDDAGKYIHKRHAIALIEFVQDARRALREGRTGDAHRMLEDANAYLLRDFGE